MRRTGGPESLNPHSFDIEMPIVCDDEYWAGDFHTPMFTQPAGKPSVMVFFNCLLHLTRILSFSCKILVPPLPLCRSLVNESYVCSTRQIAARC